MNNVAVQHDHSTLAARGSVANLWVAARPKQWVKNLTVLAPLLFAQQLGNPSAVIAALSACGLFCLMSSAVYLLNDIQDREQDRLHPRKCHRPLASGQLSVGTAFGAMGTLAITSVVLGLLLNPYFALLLAGYGLLNVSYSMGLKHHVILDVFIVAAGFVLRVISGAVAISVEVSDWLLLCTSLLALFLGFSKRRHELLLLKEEAGTHRLVLSEYNPQFLDMMIAVVTASAVMSYALYTVSAETVHKFHTRNLLATLPFVLYGIFRYLYLVYHKDLGGDPTQAILTDRPLIVNLVLWALTVIVILYW